MNRSGRSEHAENSWYCVFVLWALIFPWSFAISNSLGGMNPITPMIRQTYSDIYQQRYNEEMPESTWTLLLSLTMSMIFGGALIGSLLANLILKMLTRKKAVLAIYLLNSVGLIIIAIGLKGAMSYEMVICGRFLSGVSVGLGMTIVPLIFNEHSAPHRRQFYGAIYGTLMTLGATVTTFVAWHEIFGSYELLLGTLLYGLIFTVVFLICAYWIPETPYQIYLLHGDDAALETLQKLRMGNDDQLWMELKSYHEAGKEAAYDGHDIKPEASLKEIMASPHYRKHFFSSIVVFSLVTASGFSNVLSFADKIFLEAGLPKEVVTPATMGGYLIETIASGVAIIAMQKFDSRSLVICSNVVVVFSQALMTTSIQTAKQAPVMSWVSLAAMYLYMIAFGIVQAASFAIVGTLCVDRTRSICLFVGGFMFWFFAWFVSFISPYLSEWIQGYAFLIWMVITILGILHFVFFVPRTKGKTEVEIQEFFKK